MEEAIILRRASRRLHLLDAIIWATARVHDVPLVTSNTKDFLESDPTILVPKL